MCPLAEYMTLSLVLLCKDIPAGIVAIETISWHIFDPMLPSFPPYPTPSLSLSITHPPLHDRFCSARDRPPSSAVPLFGAAGSRGWVHLLLRRARAVFVVVADRRSVGVEGDELCEIFVVAHRCTCFTFSHLHLRSCCLRPIT